jgi:hypothetical protein
MNILEEAGGLVDGPREAEYGHPYDDFTAVAGAAHAMGISPPWQIEAGSALEDAALHHALYMVLVKIQRLVQTPGHRDSIVDGAGYFRTYEKIWERLNGN